MVSNPSFGSKVMNVLGSPRFWALMLVIGFVVLKIVWAGTPVDAWAGVLALVGFILSDSASNTPANWSKLFGEFKFWALIVGLAFVFIRVIYPAFPLSEQEVLLIVGGFTGMSIGTSYRPINTTRQ